MVLMLNITKSLMVVIHGQVQYLQSVSQTTTSMLRKKYGSSLCNTTLTEEFRQTQLPI